MNLVSRVAVRRCAQLPGQANTFCFSSRSLPLQFKSSHSRSLLKGFACWIMSHSAAEDNYASTSWDPHHLSETANYPRPGPSTNIESPLVTSSKPLPISMSSPRSSIESARMHSSSSPQDSLPAGPDRHDTLTTLHDESATLVDASFDESVLRALCELDCGVPLLLDRIKQSQVSCREAATFFKRRAAIEEEYGKAMQKLARSTSETYAGHDGKAGSFVKAWQSSMRIHETMAENRLRFAHRLNEMSEELLNLSKQVDKNRKSTKDLANQFERSVEESATITEKSKARLDATSEELERILLQKEGESFKDAGLQGRAPGGSGAVGKRALGKAVAKGGMLLKGRNPGNIQRQEDDVRARMSAASDAYRKAMLETQTKRQEYFNFQLPRLLRALKECVDEMDLGTQYHLTRYAYLFESIVLNDGSTLVPTTSDEVSGLKATMESIDSRSDFKVYMQNYAFAHAGQAPRGLRREGPQDQGFLPPLPSHPDRSHTTLLSPAGVQQSNGSNPALSIPSEPQGYGSAFGLPLTAQQTREGEDVPVIMEKCCAAIEKYGLSSQGIYRISGISSKVQKLKEKFDRDVWSIDLDADEWASDINTVASVLKLWLRELPDPLLTRELHQDFINAAKYENERQRHVELHKVVNDLPDPNYGILKFFLGHLYRINQHESENAMSTQNLAIVFGPTLFSQFGPASAPTQSNGIADAPYQNKAIETILEHYVEIFVTEGEEQ